MPKVTLVFSLPEEREEYEMAINGAKYASVISKYADFLRQQYKYQGKETIETYSAREKLFRLLEEAEVPSDGI